MLQNVNGENGVSYYEKMQLQYRIQLFMISSTNSKIGSANIQYKTKR